MFFAEKFSSACLLPAEILLSARSANIFVLGTHRENGACSSVGLNCLCILAAGMGVHTVGLLSFPSAWSAIVFLSDMVSKV